MLTTFSIHPSLTNSGWTFYFGWILFGTTSILLWHLTLKWAIGKVFVKKNNGLTAIFVKHVAYHWNLKKINIFFLKIFKNKKCKLSLFSIVPVKSTSKNLYKQCFIFRGSKSKYYIFVHFKKDSTGKWNLLTKIGGVTKIKSWYFFKSKSKIPAWSPSYLPYLGLHVRIFLYLEKKYGLLIFVTPPIEKLGPYWGEQFYHWLQLPITQPFT